MNVYDHFEHVATKSPTKTAVSGPGSGDGISYEELDQQARQVAAWVDATVQDGGRVAIYLPDEPAYLPVVLGIWRAGRVGTPLNARFGLDELEYTLSDLDPSALVTSEAFADESRQLVDRIEALEEDAIVTADDVRRFDPAAFPPATDAPETVRRLDDETAVVMYTSGTTGRPKGVVQTHRNVSAQVDVGITFYGLDETDVVLAPVPLFHVGGLYGCAIPALLAGGTVVVQRGWDATDWARLVEETSATVTGLIPTMMIDALNTDEAHAYDTSSLRIAFYGGAPAPGPALERFGDAFDVDALLNYYGQTENTGLSVTFDPGTEPEPGLMGRPTQAVEADVVEIGGTEPVDPGEPGELLLRGDVIMPRYWNDPERTAAAFTDDVPRSEATEESEDGTSGRWLRTGDVVRQDDDGRLYYVDRVDDMIVTGGENVAPSAVEDVLQGMDEIAAVAVFGTPHERWGEAVTAAIVPDEDLTEDDVLEYWESTVEMADYQKPRRIVFVDEFPRTATQKIDKSTLAERVTD
ncbi:class I adenylate-forming enzyme family protein [Halosolutus halophilus]|uniref:class I adenylate-forming enzyme family protein n=1 Tax=Halosolutus halophilus TaxID=1552990 RepID=UPI002235122B|nr:class I adenylate-forming enzyme family protein [Halosolutus halophilus]